MSQIAVDAETDRPTVLLARALILSEIASTIMVSYLMFDQVEHGALNLKLAWYWRRWKAKWDAERRFRNDLRYALWQAHKVLEESNG